MTRTILIFHKPLAARRLPEFRLPALAVLVALLLLAGCAGKSGTRWYKEGFGQADFDRDVQECRILAEEFGRQATLSGKRPDLEVQAKAYHQCLFAKGWSHIPPTAASGEEKPSWLAPVVVGEGVVVAFGSQLLLPQGFTLTGSSESVYGPLGLQSLSFQGPGPVFLNLVLQQSRSLPFEEIPYPVEEPFFLYDRGKSGTGAEWSAFFGRVKGHWVAGLGAYLLHSPRERTTVVLTAPLPMQMAPPPSGLQLDLRQHQAMERFMAEWLSWLEAVRTKQ